MSAEEAGSNERTVAASGERARSRRWWTWPLGALLLVVALMWLAGRSPRFFYQGPTTGDPRAYDVGMEAFRRGEFQVAIDRWQTVPTGDRGYSKAMRFLGWEIYAEELGDPLAGIPYVNASLWATPFDGGSWQDWSRCWAMLLTGSSW